MMVTLAERIKCGQHKQQGLFDTVVGQLKTHEKRWIVDIDTKDDSIIESIINNIDNCKPIRSRAFVTTYSGGTVNYSLDIITKVIQKIPTKSGYHLITEKFDVQEFKKHYPDVDIQKKNPTLLYYPDSIDQIS
jgi:hypothetical protein